LGCEQGQDESNNRDNPKKSAVKTARPGEKFKVRYLLSFPRDFVIITNDDSPWARGLACNSLEQRVFEAERKYEFGDRIYRNKIEEVKGRRE